MTFFTWVDQSSFPQVLTVFIIRAWNVLKHMEGPDFKTFRIVCIYNLAFLTILPKLLYQNFISNITLTFWEDPLQTTTCGTSKSLESNSLSSFSLKKSWRISREEQCGLMRLKCVAYGSLQRVLSVLRKQQGDNHLTLTITNMLFNFCFLSA